MRQIYIGLIAEGPTDLRFLSSIVSRTFEEMNYEFTGIIETNVVLLSVAKTGLSFSQWVEKAAFEGIKEFGIMILCVHTDADNIDDTVAYNSRINPAINEIKKLNDDHCKNIVAIVPVQMTEAWMLADKELLKSEIVTKKSDSELSLNNNPESYADPKFVIEEAIRIVFSELPKRRRKDLKIAELYQPMGQKISLEKLENLESYRKFKQEIRNAFRKLNYLT